MNLDNVKEKLKGPVFPTITPFNNDKTYSINYDSLKGYTDFLYDAGARSFYVMTYNGRFSLLSWDEMKEVNKAVTEHIKQRDANCVVIVADPMTNPTSVSVDFAKHAEEIGADIISCIFMERYHHDDQVYDHFKTIADNTNVGILIHAQQLDGIHGRCLYPINLLDRLADIPNVVAIKEDGKEPLYSEKVVKYISDRLSVIISGRGKRQYVHYNNMGCQSYLVGVASFLPRLAFRFHDAYQQGDMETVWGIINEIERPFFEIGMEFGWHPTLKSAMEIVGIMSRTERPPLCSLTVEQHEKVIKIIDNIKKSKYWEE